MKKSFLLSIITILFFAYSFAQNVGIGTTSPTAQFHTTGSIRHAGLAGVGIRPVFVDAAGNLLGNAPALPPSAATNSTAQGIPDINCTGTTSTKSLTGLPTDVQSASIAVTINITHPRLADLSIYLTAPGGDIINLVSPGATLGGANLTNTIFTDAGAQLSSGAAPYNGKFKPYADATPTVCGITQTAGSFATIGGGTINPNGAWTLKVIDNTASNTGTLNDWTISVVPGIDGVWGVKGNSGTNAYNFLGTTDNTPLQFKVNNVRSGYIDINNVYLGYQSGSNIITGEANTAVGARALYKNTTGSYNTATGLSALESNTTGNRNTANGAGALAFNTTGSYNSAFGRAALNSNTTGNFNTASGESALNSNTTGNSNMANGHSALYSNTTGVNNTANGNSALFSNTTGNENTANGTSALVSNTTGSSNTANGVVALSANTTGDQNTACGLNALSFNTTGNNNTALGYGADVSSVNLTNATALGYNAIVTTSNKVRIGNTNVTRIEGQVAYSFPSDGRFKYDIQPNVPGLDFIKKLIPVTYYFDEEKLAEYAKTGVINNSNIKRASYNGSKQLHTGFLAQDVEKIAKELGYSFDGVRAPANDRDHYSLAYTQSIMPLVKAVQEQQQIIEAQKVDVELLKAQVAELTEATDKLLHVTHQRDIIR